MQPKGGQYGLARMEYGAVLHDDMDGNQSYLLVISSVDRFPPRRRWLPSTASTMLTVILVDRYDCLGLAVINVGSRGYVCLRYLAITSGTRLRSYDSHTFRLPFPLVCRRPSYAEGVATMRCLRTKVRTQTRPFRGAFTFGETKIT